MTIAAHDWVTLNRLLETVLGLPAPARDAWLETLGTEHAALVPVLRQLLARPDLMETAGFLATLPKIPGAREESRTDATPGDVVGPYQLERMLGTGGMGSVWLAKRVDGLFERHVALKLPHFNGALAELAARMARERNILAALEHPAIARLYDAGVAEDGRPYLALEYVQGQSIDTFCSSQSCSVRARVELILQVARAVAFAHAHLVVHRDLKPSNIMVDAQQRVRLLDFGIAKLLDVTVPAGGSATQFAAVALTPSYASPEQLRGETVSTASDVYSLGVVLYELLAGARPFRAKQDGNALALAQAITTMEPPKPSAAAAEASVRRQLRGDLDTIVLKALKKAPEERYATIVAMADDLERYLRSEPVLARPDSFWYRTSRLVSRNKALFGALAAVVIALSTGLGVSLWQAARLRTEERTSHAVEQFLEDIFRTNSNDQTNPAQARQTTVTQLLQLGAKKVDESLKDAPQSRLRVLGTLAQMHNDLQLYDDAVALNRKRLDLSRKLYGHDDARNVDTMIDLANAMQESRSNTERGAVLDEALRILDRNGDRSSHLRGHLLGELSSVYQELDVPRALGYATESVHILRALPVSRELDGSLLMQGYLLTALHRYPEAETALKESLSVSKAVQGEKNAELPRLYGSLADTQFYLQKFADAEQSYRSAWQLSLSQLGPGDVDTILAEARLGQFQVRTSRPREGIAHVAQASAAAAKSLGMDDSLYNPTFEVYYGRSLLDVGRAQDAVPHLTHALEVLHRYRPGSIGGLIAAEKLALAYANTGDLAAAPPLLDEAKAQRERTGDRNTNLNGGVEARVALLLAQGKPAEAERALGDLYLPPGDDAPDSMAAMQAALLRAEVALARQQGSAAAQLAGKVRERLAANPQRSYLKAFEARAELIEGKATALGGDFSRAEKLLRHAMDLDAQIYDAASSPLLADAQVALADCLLQLKQPDEARALEAHARAIDAVNAKLGPAHHQPLLDLQARLRKLTSPS